MKNNLDLSSIGTFYHSIKAFLAALTALSTSFALAAAIYVISSPVQGLYSGRVFPDSLSTNSLYYIIFRKINEKKKFSP